MHERITSMEFFPLYCILVPGYAVAEEPCQRAGFESQQHDLTATCRISRSGRCRNEWPKHDALEFKFRVQRKVSEVPTFCGFFSHGPPTLIS